MSHATLLVYSNHRVLFTLQQYSAGLTLYCPEGAGTFAFSENPSISGDRLIRIHRAAFDQRYIDNAKQSGV